jgi:hypothetical protein
MAAQISQRGRFHRAPAITPEIIERISGLAHTTGRLDGGFSPFLGVVVWTPDEQAEARERSRVYSMMHAGTAPTFGSVDQPGH